MCELREYSKPHPFLRSHPTSRCKSSAYGLQWPVLYAGIMLMCAYYLCYAGILCSGLSISYNLQLIVSHHVIILGHADSKPYKCHFLAPLV